MNHDDSHTDLRLTAAAAIAFAALIGTILTLAFATDPTGNQLRAIVTTLGIAVAIALGTIVGTPVRSR